MGFLAAAAATSCSATTVALRDLLIAKAIPKSPSAVTTSGIVGSGVMASRMRKHPVMMSPRGWLTIWSASSSPNWALLPERVTMSAEAIETTRAGIWLVSPSPMVSLVKTSAVLPASQPFWSIPTAKPPRMLTAVMMIPAIASPRTNFDAPSIAPKKSASWPTRARRRRASFSSMTPALRSESMAICFPGIASRVKRAATSEIRVAPLLTTINCTITRMRKMMTPTKSESPATKLPNAAMTCPATCIASSGEDASAVSTSRVEAMLSTSR